MIKRSFFIRAVVVLGLYASVLGPARADAGAAVPTPENNAQPAGPVRVANFERPARIAKLPDGRLFAAFIRNGARGQEAAARYSGDNGYTWGEPQTLLSLEEGGGRFGGPEVLIDRDGEVHLFLTNPSPANDGLPLPKRRIDIWHVKSVNGRRSWQRPKPIWEGYTGSLNSVIQLRSGRILLPFSYVTERTWRNRGEGFEAFTYMGQFDCTLVYSDDAGQTWRRSPAALKVPAPNLSTYGAIEPVVIELKDGRVWMLIRTQLGRFYESFSPDGVNWSPPQPSAITSSDSPAGLARLEDGRLALFWNNSLRFPYAYGGRHVLHAAISEDEGRTWRGYREVAHDPLNNQPPPPTGDHGTAYPFPRLARNGLVIFSSGQGEGRRFNALLDPRWLYQTTQAEDFSHGLDGWSVFGTRGVELVPHPRKEGARALSLRKSDPSWPAAAVWNFPSGKAGRLRLRLLLEAGFGGLNIGLTDHFSVPFDEEDQFHNLYNLQIATGGTLANGTKVAAGRWHNLELAWNAEKRICQVLLDGSKVAVLPLLREGAGVSYLRMRSTADTTGTAGVLIERVEADVSESWRPPRK